MRHDDEEDLLYAIFVPSVVLLILTAWLFLAVRPYDWWVA